MERIYFDHNATTFLHPQVRLFLKEAEEKYFGNSSSIHWAGREARSFLNRAREKIASLLGAKESEILFNSGGSESINTALRGVAALRASNRRKILTTPIEHPAVLKTCEFLKSQGFALEFFSVDSQGRLDLHEARQKIDSETLLVSVMWANNELGNLNPIEQIGALCQAQGALFHCDAVQAAGKVPIDLQGLSLDLLSFSGHKFHGPKGVGALYVREGISISPLLWGGAQEKSLRAGTQDTLRIYGMALALEECLRTLSEDSQKVNSLRNQLEKGILDLSPSAKINGDRERRLPNTTNLLFPGIDGETLLMNLDLRGIAASAGSACESGSIDPSHVLLALGRSAQEAKSSVRFSLSKWNTTQEVERTLEVLSEILKEYA